MASVLEEKDQIRELLAEYCFHFDTAQFERWVELWADDAVFDVDGHVMRGRTGLQQFTKATLLVNGKPPLKHYVMNEVIAVNGDTATSKCYLLVVRKKEDGSLICGSAGTYEDRLVKKNGRWLFSVRTVRRDLRDEEVKSRIG